MSTIPGILPPHVQFELQQEMQDHGYDPSGNTEGMGWNAFADYCKQNPGTCERFDNIREQLETNGNSPMERLDRSLGDGVDWIEEAKGRLLGVFEDESWNPDNNEIYASRADIKLEFMSDYVGASANGTDIDPLVAERMEQLLAMHPDTADSRYHNAMEKVLAEPEKFGLETEAPGFFSDNEGVVFSPN